MASIHINTSSQSILEFDYKTFADSLFLFELIGRSSYLRRDVIRQRAPILELCNFLVARLKVIDAPVGFERMDALIYQVADCSGLEQY